MNKERILNSAEKIFGKIDQIGNDIYKGIWQVKNKTAGIYFIDVSGKVATDFAQYQEDVLSKEYYENPGPLQWNYYLMLLQDEVNPEVKKNIERDERYARKIVLNETQFSDYFSLEKVEQDEKINPITEWKEKLDAVDLQELHGSDPVATVLTRFENNATKKIKFSSSKRPKTDDLDKVSKISYLKLNDNYRPQPSIREFFFGSVNLITGINGVGKTSLFEAVEMIICGKFLRGRKNKRNEAPGSIEAIFNDSKSLIKFDPSTAANEKYRLRDQKWYANNKAREHELDISFNRYNYFSADAAFHFSNSDSREAVREALLNIVLGSEYDHIMQRMDKAYDRLRPQLKKFEYDKLEATEEKHQTEKEIDSIKKESDLDSFRLSIKDGLSSLSFIDPPNEIDMTAGHLEQIVSGLLVILENIKKENLVFTVNKMAAWEADFKWRKDLVAKFKAFLFNHNKEKAAYELEHEKLQVVKILLNDCLIYFSDERFFKMEGYSEKVRELEAEQAKISRIRLFLEAAETEKFSGELSLTELFNININTLNEAYLLESNYKTRRDNYLKTTGDIAAAIQEIKTLGRQFLLLDPSCQDCPMCQSHFDPEQLKSRIEQIVQLPDQNNSVELKEVSDSLKEVEGIIKELNQEKVRLEQYRSALHLAKISPDSPTQDSLRELREMINLETVIEKQVQELTSVTQYANELNLSESGLVYLKERLAADKTLPELRSGNKALFDKALADIQGHIDSINFKMSQLLEDRAKASFDFKMAFGLSTDTKLTQAEIEKLVDTEQRSIDSLKECFRQVQEIINVDGDTDILTLQLPLELLQKTIQSFRNELSNQYMLNQAKVRLAEAELKLKKSTEGIKRFKPACETLKKILDDKGGEQVNSFFARNLLQIMDIFQSIHSPREFIDISLRNDTLYLKMENGTEREITAISTGQRSALALSIFLTLNRKLQNGPDIIMFDDPVSFIDDLNAVSFLDFLRYFVLKENKQIFFATANKRLANLFDKKFSFLGEPDFKRWELTR